MSEAAETPGAAALAPPDQVVAPAEVRREPWHLSDTLLSLAGTVVIALFVITFLVQAFEIPSRSMENTLKVGDYLLVDKVHYAEGGLWGRILPYSAIRRGDIIVFRYPLQPAQHFVKRVIGLPGDRIRLVDKQVYVNGQPLSEPYARHIKRDVDAYRDYFPNFGATSNDVNPRWWMAMHNYVQRGELLVPPGHYFVLGDNRDDSEDSRYWGFVPRENIVGQPLLIYWSVDGGEDSAGAGDDKLSGSLVSSVLRFFGDTRWERTLRLVK